MSGLPVPQVELRPTESFDNLAVVGRQSVQHIYRFLNGYSVSVICGPYSYGGPEGLWEALAYSAESPLEEPVGWLTDAGVAVVLAEVAGRPAVPSARVIETEQTQPDGCVERISRYGLT